MWPQKHTDSPATSQEGEHLKLLDRLFESRHSCRGFRPDHVPRNVIEDVVRVAQKTPSWCNAQPWQVVITCGDATERFRQALLQHIAQNDPSPDILFPREYRGVYLERRRDCGFQLYESVGIERGDRAASGKQARENFRLFGAPHVAIVSTDEALGTYGAIDCGAFVSNFMLAATSVGIATIAQASLAGHSRFVHQHFGIPDDRMIVCGISFGYENSDHPANRFRTRRASLDEVLTWHTA